ncbi:NADPH:quinone oxidoreductase family protein [Nocardioides sp. CBS4Y-1]|uniref:NADPH:quinone oxidoreductase family protein n=2 Tax=Nocardioides acrostichi TaxID=2784339 RepID=A0A930UW80_9ACTN|nr:NADPH:quinone oxidoreductase family protein [Nocardioides acrostichi]
MQALELIALRGPDGLRLGERPVPSHEGMVVIETHAAGVCFPDLLMSRGKYQVSPQLPAVMGQEVAGRVLEAPRGSRFSPGDRVWALLESGGHAEVVAAPPERTFALPDDVDYVDGAALGVNYLTSAFALHRRGDLRAGESILVLGAAGGLGTAMVGMARAMGAVVHAVVSTDDKVATAREAGAHQVYVGDGFRDAVMATTGGRGVDCVADIVGGDLTVQAVRSTRPEGRVLVLGFTNGIGAVPSNRLLLRNVSLVGAGMGPLMAHVPDLLTGLSVTVVEALAAGLRPLIDSTFPLARGAEALRRMEDREARGKLVLQVRSDTRETAEPALTGGQ